MSILIISGILFLNTALTDINVSTPILESEHNKTYKITSMQSDQDLCLTHEEALGPWLPIEHPVKTAQLCRLI